MRSLALVALFALGCDDDGGPASPVDGGLADSAGGDAATPDAATPLDAAPLADGGAGPDARPEADASAPADVLPLDAGPGPDAGAGEDAGPPPPLGTCDLAAFEPCGGDLSGVWRLLDFCTPAGAASEPRVCEGPGEDEALCMGGVNERTCSLLYGGTVDFADGQASSEFSVSFAARYVLDSPCLGALYSGREPADACAGLGNDLGRGLPLRGPGGAPVGAPGRRVLHRRGPDHGAGRARQLLRLRRPGRHRLRRPRPRGLEGLAAAPLIAQPPSIPSLSPALGGLPPSQMPRKAFAQSAPARVPFTRPLTFTSTPAPGT